MRLLMLTLILVFLNPAYSTPDRLIVATKEAAPFSLKGTDQRWEGISIELWEEIARHRGWEYEYREMSLEEMLQALEAGSIDLAAAALTLPSNSPLRESLNQALLEVIRDPQWNAILQKYTGESQ